MDLKGSIFNCFYYSAARTLPSTTRPAPLINLALSLAKNRQAFAISTAPSWENSLAISLPIPELAPVTTTDLSLNLVKNRLYSLPIFYP